MTPLERFDAALRAHGHTPRKAGSGSTCRCPSHDDHDPSLTFNVGANGGVVVTCHAGCTVDAICSAIGLRVADLFADDPDGRGRGAPKAGKRVTVTKTPTKSGNGQGSGDRRGRTFPTAAAAVAHLERRLGPRSAMWTYRNAAGEPVGLILRWNTPTGKRIRPVSLTADGLGWSDCGMPAPRPLYALPDLLRSAPADRVYVNEGEKAADATRVVGLLATTSAHGADAPEGSDWSALAGRDVVILPDNDAAGEKYAAAVARLALAAGAKAVRIVRLIELWPEIPEGGDMADFLEHRGGDKDAVRAEVEALAAATAPQTAATDTPTLPRFDLDAAFPDRAKYARDYIAALSRSTQTPVEMPALLSLAIASAALCNVARVRGHGDHIEPAPIWALVLCEPAARKTAVHAELLAPIVDWEQRRAKELGPLIAEAVQRRKINEKRLKVLEEKAARKNDAGAMADAIALAQTIAAEPIPSPPVLLASEPTPEALSRQMAQNCGRALLASAEGDMFDIAQGRYNGGARNYGLLLKGHAGDAVRAQRIGRPGDTIDHPALALALCVQPRAARDLWNDRHAEGCGLLARFAVIAPPDRIGRRDVRPKPVPDTIRARWWAAIARKLTVEPSDTPLIVSLSADADALYYNFQVRTEKSLGIGELSECRSWGGKLCGLVLRIALTLHALETWALSGRPDDFPTIGAECMRAAIAWADYLIAAERHAREMLRESDAEAETRKLVDWIDGTGGVVTANDLAHRRRAYRDNPDAAEQALIALVGAGRGRWEVEASGPKGGRPTRRFRLNSTVPVTETPEMPGEADSFGDSDTGDADAADSDAGDDGAAAGNGAREPPVETRPACPELAGGLATVPPGWNAVGWRARLLQMAKRCKTDHPDRAAALRAAADSIQAGRTEGGPGRVVAIG